VSYFISFFVGCVLVFFVFLFRHEIVHYSFAFASADYEQATPCVFMLPTIQIPVVKQDASSAYVDVQFQFEMNSCKNISNIDQLYPIIVDAVFCDLYEVFFNRWDAREAPGENILKERMFYVLNKVLGQGRIKSVYITDLVNELCK